jgi:hypothetical protein
LFLAAGNHDLSRDSQKLSSFHLLATLLQWQHPSRVTIILEPQRISTNALDFYVIPHLVDQAAFDTALSQIPPDTTYVFLHANYDNHFAVQADHSLNVSQEQAQTLIDQGHILVFGHEHQQRTLPSLVITGNQFPTSIADCLGNSSKRAFNVNHTGHGFIETWNTENSFYRVDWREIDTVPADAQFIRVEGQAELEEAAEAVKLIGKLRQSHSAFVISNAVKVRQDELSQEDVESLEDVKKFDILKYLLESLTEDQAKKVKELLND